MSDNIHNQAKDLVVALTQLMETAPNERNKTVTTQVNGLIRRAKKALPSDEQIQDIPEYTESISAAEASLIVQLIRRRTETERPPRQTRTRVW